MCHLKSQLTAFLALSFVDLQQFVAVIRVERAIRCLQMNAILNRLFLWSRRIEKPTIMDLKCLKNRSCKFDLFFWGRFHLSWPSWILLWLKTSFLNRSNVKSHSFFLNESESVGPDWAIYCTLGNFSKPVAAIILPKLSIFLGDFCKSVKILHFF